MKPKMFNRTPLMDLGSWVRGHAMDRPDRGDIVGCPWRILDCAHRHLELRIRTVEARPSNHRARSTLRWLRRWQALAEAEMVDQRDRARSALQLDGPARHRCQMHGVIHAYRDARDARFVCGARMVEVQAVSAPGSLVTCLWCLPRVARMAAWGKEDARV